MSVPKPESPDVPTERTRSRATTPTTSTGVTVDVSFFPLNSEGVMSAARAFRPADRRTFRSA